MSRFVLAALLLAATAAQSQTLQPAGSEIVFVSKQMGVPVEGRFQRFSLPGFSFDPKKPEAAKVAIQIDLRSASMGAADVEAGGRGEGDALAGEGDGEFGRVPGDLGGGPCPRGSGMAERPGGQRFEERGEGFAGGEDVIGIGHWCSREDEGAVAGATADSRAMIQ